MKHSQTLTTTTRPPPMSHFRGAFLYAEAFYVMMVLVWGLFIWATCESCSMNGIQRDVQYANCGSLKENSNTEVGNGFSNTAYSSEAVPEQHTDNVCQQGNLFCFRSTLPGFSSSSLKSPVCKSDIELSAGLKNSGVNESWMMDSGGFNLRGGRSLSCSLSYQDISPGLHIKSSKQDDMSSCMKPTHDHKDDYTHTMKSSTVFPLVEINPTVLDWGEQYLYFPSSASITVRNTHGDIILNLYEPYSSSPHFYPCNFSEILLAPGETVLVSFMFFPTLLGSSSGQLILQTNAGGFLIHAKGFVVESPYAIQPLVGQDISVGKLRENLSLFNPFNESIFVEELAVWIVVSSGNSSRLTKAICSVDTTKKSTDFRFTNVQEWLSIRSSELDLPIVSMRPNQNWEIAPGKTETVIHVDISHSAEGKISGAVCMQLFNATKKMGKIMVPLDAKWRGSSTSAGTVSHVSVSVDVFLPCDTNGTVVASLSVRNDAVHMLRIVKVSVVGGSRKHFDIKYIEGLLLFPGTNTQVALATYTMVVQNGDSGDDTTQHDRSCKLLIQTNESSTIESEIHCDKVAEFCFGHGFDSSTGHQQPGVADRDNSLTKLRGGDDGSLPPSKVLDSAEADELVLMNWKSHATASNTSILFVHEMIFAAVQVGSHLSEWITVTNPSRQPVVMQLILNSAEIIDECQELNRLQLLTSFSSLVNKKSYAPTRYGFSIAENAVTEAFVHPYERAILGPIVFQPSKRCGWKGSALIRNNLSGVEWLSLQGFGGSLSLSLLEDSEPVQRLEFKLSLPALLNFSSPNNYRTVDRTQSCSDPSQKELYAKNTGDLPLEVRKIKVSGTACGLDGFLVHTCGGFSLEPGESKKFVISYQTDYSAATLYRDLELALTTGILVIPMKASVPMDMLHFCKRSMLLVRFKKYITVFLSVLGPFVVVCYILPHLSTFTSQGYLLRTGESSVSNTGKSLLHITQSASKFRISTQIDGLIKLTVEEEVLPLKSVCGVSDGQVLHDGEFPYGDGMERSSYLDKKETISPKVVSLIDRTNIQEVPQDGNMTIKIGNEKRRRRRKKRGSAAGLPSVFEVSSSHSGNSTPTSPLSSSSSSTPRPWLLSPDGNQFGQVRNLFARDEKRIDPNPVLKVSESGPGPGSGNWFSSAQEKHTTPKIVPVKPVLLPSATFPRAGRQGPDLMSHPSLVILSKVVPHARAPGSKLHDVNSRKGQEKMSLEEKFTYDIWGDHIFGKPLTGQSTFSKKQPYAIENNFSSFFVMGPQALMKNFKMSVSSVG